MIRMTDDGGVSFGSLGMGHLYLFSDQLEKFSDICREHNVEYYRQLKTDKI